MINLLIFNSIILFMLFWQQQIHPYCDVGIAVKLMYNQILEYHIPKIRDKTDIPNFRDCR